MGALAAIPGILQLLGGVFGSQSSGSSQTNTTGDSSSSENLTNILNSLQQMQQQGTTAGTQTTSLSPQMQAMLNQVSSSVQPFNQGAYVAGQTQQIEGAGNQQQAQVNNEMASRGLATSPVAATAQGNVQQNTLNQVTGMQQQAPLVAQQANLANLGAAASLVGVAPKTTTTAGTTTGTQTGTTSQSGSTVGTTTGTTATSSGTNSTQKQGGVLSPTTSPLPNPTGGNPIFSDERLKTNIKPLPHEEALDKLMKLRPSTWNWRADGTQDSGVIAQDVEKVYPHAVSDDPETGYKKVDLQALMPHIIASIQALRNGKTAGGE
jgi:hypothetical protein